jgi:hypothetical protein
MVVPWKFSTLRITVNVVFCCKWRKPASAFLGAVLWFASVDDMDVHAFIYELRTELEKLNRAIAALEQLRDSQVAAATGAHRRRGRKAARKTEGGIPAYDRVLGGTQKLLAVDENEEFAKRTGAQSERAVPAPGAVPGGTASQPH